ncbi:MAG: CPBP family intramembrane glutamic endopeptidase [Planctomycetota bacterium]
MLLFLAPLLILFEAGSLLYLTDAETGVVETISAYSILGRASEAFGIAGFAVPGILLIVGLLIWHTLLRDPWRADPATLAGMLIESIAWTLPLLAIAALIGPTSAVQLDSDPGGQLAAAQPGDWPWQARLTLAVGAGLYEEMLFRLLLIPLVIVVFRDLIRLRASSSRFAAIGLSALLFAAYHDLSGPGGIDAARLLFFLVAGVYFGALFVWRGFGIVVGVHAAYDIVVLLVLTK